MKPDGYLTLKRVDSEEFEIIRFEHMKWWRYDLAGLWIVGHTQHRLIPWARIDELYVNKNSKEYVAYQEQQKSRIRF